MTPNMRGVKKEAGAGGKRGPSSDQQSDGDEAADNDTDMPDGTTISDIVENAVSRVVKAEADAGGLELRSPAPFVEIACSIFNTLSLSKPEDVPQRLVEDEAYEDSYRQFTHYVNEIQRTGQGIVEYFGGTMMKSLILAHSNSIIKELRCHMGSEQMGESVFRELCGEVGLDEKQTQLLLSGGLSSSEEVSSELPSQSGLGFLSRDLGGKREEDLGIITFEGVTNDRRPKSMEKLICLKNIFARQLPKMPKEYIVRLVLDRKHHSYCLLKQGRVIGGCCFRPYFEARFAEIAFLAIISTEQVKGYGTRLMNQLKEYVKSMEVPIDHFLTYADNFAIGYFHKQGFSKQINMPRERWNGYIKDYDGGTLMECYIDPKINYVNLASMLRKQRQAVHSAIVDCRHRARYAGLRQWKENPGMVCDPLTIPGVAEAGWKATATPAAASGKTESLTLDEQLLSLLKAVMAAPSSWPFRKPVEEGIAPDYRKIIKAPTDIQTMLDKVKKKEYKNKEQFAEEIERMFENCRVYNREDTIYYKLANELEEFVKPILDAIKDPSAPQETSNDPSISRRKEATVTPVGDPSTSPSPVDEELMDPAGDDD